MLNARPDISPITNPKRSLVVPITQNKDMTDSWELPKAINETVQSDEYDSENSEENPANLAANSQRADILAQSSVQSKAEQTGNTGYI
jgi:hypothetical protein